MRKDKPDAPAQSLPCWFCEARFTSRHVARDGILRSRSERSGGPYRLYVCPSCGRENLCERSRRGRWFASPNYKFTFLDYLFSQVLDPRNAETILAALTWFRENEERRRYFFERDDDKRYSGRSLLSRFWPTVPQRARFPSSSNRASRGEPRQKAEAPPKPLRRRFVTPYEVLGLPSTASDREVREAFHRLAILYHPDKVHHLGEDFERLAKEKFQALKDAYEALLALRSRKA